MSARRYTLGLFLLVVLTLAAVAAFNRVIDPFWYYRDIEIAGLNAVKPRFARFERNVKPALLARERPEAIVLGSSFAEIGFDPLDAALTDNGRLLGYNFALAGTGWDMEQCAFDYALRHSKIKRAVLGIQPGELPKADCSKVWQGMTASSVQLLLSTHALNNAIRTVVEQRRARPSHTREGRYLYSRGAPGAATRFREFFLRDAKKQTQCMQQQLATPVAAQAEAQTILPVPDVDFAGLRAVIHAARTQETEIAFVIYPRHALSLELEFACGDPQARWRYIAAIAQAIAEAAPDGIASLWVFDGYDAPRGERVVGREPVFWQDPEHFNFELGARMLATIYGREQGFGARVVLGNIDALYTQLMAQRKQFVAATDWFYDDLRALAAPASVVR
jgi:hypothetical protein